MLPEAILIFQLDLIIYADGHKYIQRNLKSTIISYRHRNANLLPNMTCCSHANNRVEYINRYQATRRIKHRQVVFK